MALRFGKLLREAGSRLPAALLRPLERPAALFFHGVERRIDDSRVQNNHHDLSQFFDICTQLARDFEVLPLDRLGAVLKAPERHRRAVFLMSDDGYRNTLGEAAEVLGRFGLPWTLFCSTRHIDTAERNPVFVARLFFLFVDSGKYDIENLSATLDIPDTEDRERLAEIWIARLRQLDAARADAAVAAMARALGERLSPLLQRFSSDSFLSWDEVRALASRGVEIGAHAHRHWPMHEGQSTDYLREQAALSRARVEAEVGPCRYFAYPFGNTSDVCRKAWHAVRDAGFDYAFTTLSGTLDASANPYLMPRYGLALQEARLASVVPVLRAGNARLAAWQRALAG